MNCFLDSFLAQVPRMDPLSCILRYSKFRVPQAMSVLHTRDETLGLLRRSDDGFSAKDLKNVPG